MSQTYLLIIEVILCFSTLLLLYKIYHKTGIYAYCIISIILTSIMSLKTITLYDYDMNLGIIPFITLFTASNILIQKNGPEEPKALLLITTISSLIGYVILLLINYITPSNINLFMSASYDNIFDGSIRFLFANFVTTLYSLLLNMKLYYALKKIKNNILISNLFSTIIIHFIASIIFCLIAYVFTKDPIDIIKIIMIRYLVSLCVGVLSTIVIYITKFVKIDE